MKDAIQAPFPGLVEVKPDGTQVQRIAPLAERRVILQWQEIPIEAFKEMFLKSAGAAFDEHWQKIEHLYLEYGPVLSIPIGSVLMYAAEDQRLPWCIELLEKHLDEDLGYQHPELRGRLIIGDDYRNRSEAFIVTLIRELRPQLFKG
jgi:hypothetical protein